MCSQWGESAGSDLAKGINEHSLIAVIGGNNAKDDPSFFQIRLGIVRPDDFNNFPDFFISKQQENTSFQSVPIIAQQRSKDHDKPTGGNQTDSVKR